MASLTEYRVLTYDGKETVGLQAVYTDLRADKVCIRTATAASATYRASCQQHRVVNRVVHRAHKTQLPTYIYTRSDQPAYHRLVPFMCTCMCTNRSIIPCGNVSLCWLQTPSDACCACLLACLSAWCTPPALDRPREPQLVGSPFREQEGDPPPHPLSRWASAGGAGRGREGSAGQSAAAGRLAPLQLQEKGTST